jgi:ABC-type multidrug transport system fused ATPase/permease subunit
MKTVFRELFRVLSPHYRRRTVQLQVGAFIQALLDAIAFGLLYPLLELLTATATTHPSRVIQITGDLLGTQEPGPLKLRLGIAIVTFFLLSSACGVLLTRAQSKVAAHSEADVASRLFSSYLNAPYLQHIQRNSGELNRNVITACIEVHQNVLLGFLILGQNLFTIGVLVAVIAVVNPLVTAISVIYFVAAAYLYGRVVSPKTIHAGEESLAIAGLTYKASQEGFQGLKAFQASDTIPAVIADYRSKRNQLAHHRYKMTFYGLVPQYYIQGAMIGGVVLFTLVISLSGTGNVTALVGLIVAASVRLMPCLYQILSSINKIRTGQASVHEVYSDLQRLSKRRSESIYEPPQESGSAAGWIFTQSIVFERVSFMYPSAVQAALTDISLVIPKGSSVGFVGSSGAGKTTMIDLLLGMFPPSEGRLLLDGEELGGEMIQSWRSQIAYVPQEIFLIDGSVSHNVCFDKSIREIDATRVWEALERAHVADFVRGLPDGIETLVGESGVRFSGGQRQRLGIARALYRRPTALILDEATSALDTPTEAAFASTIQQLRGTLTLITVAHRLSTVRHCDTIFLMDEGRLIAQGPFEELRRESGLFDQMARHAQIHTQ